MYHQNYSRFVFEKVRPSLLVVHQKLSIPQSFVVEYLRLALYENRIVDPLCAAYVEADKSVAKENLFSDLVSTQLREQRPSIPITCILET